MNCSRRHPSLQHQAPRQSPASTVCSYFQRGHCSRGNSCRYLHQTPTPTTPQPAPVAQNNPKPIPEPSPAKETPKTQQ